MTKTKRIRFLLCMILSVVLLLTMSGGVLAEPEDNVVTEEVTDEGTTVGEIELVGYEQVAQSGDLTMFANRENGYFYLENAVTGKQWHSVPIDVEYDEVSKGASTRGAVRSQLIIGYVNRSEMATVEYAQEANSNSDCIGEGGLAVNFDAVENGMRVDYHFPAVGITVPVEYKLEDGDFYATVLVDEIKEEAVEGNEYILIDITLLPAFGAGNWETEGYLFVPDGCGALVEFNNGIQLSSNYKSMIYGSDMSIVPETQVTYTENIRLPVFGTVIGEDALMGIVTVGDATSSITLINGHARCGYNAVSSIFHYRVMQAQYNLFNKRKVNLVAEPEYGLSTYEVRYSTLTGEDADYIGMATKYREYLIEEKGLTKQGSTPTFHLDAVGAFEQAATFLGIIPYTERVALTTYDECVEMLKDLQEAGLEDITLKYIGWSNNGIENVKLPKAVKALSVLGGKSDLSALQTYTATEGITFYPEVDLMRFQKSGNGVSIQKNSIRTIFGKTTYQPKFMLSTYVTQLGSDTTALLSPEKLSWAGNRYLTSLQKQGMSAVSLSTMGEYCYSNFYAKNEQYRSQFPTFVAETLQPYKDAGVSMSFDGGNAYVLPYASLITNVPTHSSGYDIFAEDVPFYQAVLHGYIPYTTESLPQTADPEAAYLAAVETGTELAYIGIHEQASELFDTEYNNLYGSTYTLWIEKAVAQYKEYMPLLEKIYDKVIVDHREIADDVYMTEYEDGTQVIVNYNDEAVTVQDQEIPAKSFTDEIKWEEVTVNEEG